MKHGLIIGGLFIAFVVGVPLIAWQDKVKCEGFYVAQWQRSPMIVHCDVDPIEQLTGRRWDGSKVPPITFKD